jgi:uncharacterized protein (DUF2249 family)
MSDSKVNLDLRAVPETDQWDAFVKFFQDTEAGGAFQVQVNRDFSFLREGLQEHFLNCFEWWPLETGPVTWRVAVARRKEAGQAVTLCELYARDHRRMRGLLQRARGAVDAGDRQQAAAHFAEFQVGLLRHAAGEESLLFPVFKSSGLPGVEADLEGFVREHHEIISLVAGILDLLGSEERFDQPHLDEALRQLWRTVQVHESQEEKILLPLCDRMMTDSERAQAVKDAHNL